MTSFSKNKELVGLVVAYTVAITILFALLCVIRLCVTLRPGEEKVFTFLGITIYMVTLISAVLFIYEEDLCHEKQECFISINIGILLLETLGLILAMYGLELMKVLQTFFILHLFISGAVGFFVYEYEWTILGSTFIFSSIMLFLYQRKEKNITDEDYERLTHRLNQDYSAIQFV